MGLRVIQDIIDFSRGKKKEIIFFDVKLYIKLSIKYFDLISNKRETDSDKQLIGIIFKFDDLTDYKGNVVKLDKYVKKRNLKVCWGIIGKSMLNANRKYIKFIKENNKKNYHFFNHGYYHLGGSEYEFSKKTNEEQSNLIRKTQNIVFEKTGIILNSFGAPCNRIDENTKSALENISEIKYWFYGTKTYNGINLIRTIEMEKGVGNIDFEYFKSNWENFDKENIKYVTIQGHPYMWNKIHFLSFKCIVEYLKQQGCEFILPEDIGDTFSGN